MWSYGDLSRAGIVLFCCGYVVCTSNYNSFMKLMCFPFDDTSDWFDFFFTLINERKFLIVFEAIQFV